MRMSVSSTREQSINVITFFVKLFFNYIFYPQQFFYFYHLKTNV